MRRANKAVIVINILVWTLSTLVFYILPQFFGISVGPAGYLPFFFFFILPFFGNSRRRSRAQSEYYRNTTQKSPALDGSQTEEYHSGGASDYYNMENFGVSAPNSRISWQLVVFVLILVVGAAFLILRYGF